MSILRTLLVGTCLGTSVLLAGCTLSPDPLSVDELKVRAQVDRSLIERMQAPVAAELSLEDVIARALTHNLDLRAESLQRLVDQDALILAQLGLLPNVSGSIDSNRRDSPAGSEDDTSVPNTARRVKVFQAQWSVLDFGVSYLEAQKKGNEGLAAEERRTKAANALVKDVIYGFYQSQNAQRNIERLLGIEEKADNYLVLVDKLIASRLEDPMSLLSLKSSLLQIKRRVATLRQAQVAARESLLHLLNLPADHPLHLKGAMPAELAPAAAKLDTERAVDQALIQRSELREFDYQARNAHNDVWASYLTLLPNITGSYSKTTDTYTTNAVRTWSQTGVTGVFKLFSLLSFPWANGKAENTELAIVMRRMAMSLAVMEQVKTSKATLAQLQENLQIGQALAETNQEIMKLWDGRLPFALTDELSRLRAEIEAILADTERDQNQADQQRGVAELMLSIGLPLAPPNLDVDHPDTLSQQVSTHLAALQQAVEELASTAPMPPSSPLLVDPTPALPEN